MLCFKAGFVADTNPKDGIWQYGTWSNHNRKYGNVNEQVNFRFIYENRVANELGMLGLVETVDHKPIDNSTEVRK